MKYRLQLQYTEVKTNTSYAIMKPGVTSSEVESAIAAFLKTVEDGTNQLMNIVVQLDAKAPM